MRVLIVGGLGYIGSELLEQYKSDGDNTVEIDVLDKRFVTNTLAGLPGNVHFFQGDMKDDSAIGPLLAKEPDIIYSVVSTGRPCSARRPRRS